MNLKTVYTTSKGLFWDKAEAEKKVNRAKEYGSRPGDPVEYEKLLPDICPWADAAKEGPMKGWHVQFVARKHFGVKE